MKIGIICPYNVFIPGGVQEHVEHQAKLLRERGHTVMIITPRPNGHKSDPPEGVLFLGKSTRMKINAPFHTEFDVSASTDTKQIDAILEAYKFDIIHAHEPWLPMMPYQVLQRSEAKNVGTLHARWPESTINKMITKARTPYIRSTLRRLDHVTAVSDESASNMTDLEDLPKDIPLSLIPNGLDLSVYQPAKVRRISKYSGGKKTILFIGRLEKRKGVEYLLKAYRQLLKSDSNVRLVIAGRGAKLDTLQNYVDRHKLKDVEFLGYVDDKTKMRLLKSCDLFCSPAIFGESFGIVLLEAMSMAAVTVAGDNAGYRAVMTGLGKLSLVNPKNAKEFANRLELLLHDKDLRDLWRQWAAEHVKQFDYSKIVDQYEAVYNSLVKK